MITTAIKLKKDSKGMDDDLIFLLSVNILGLFIIGAFQQYLFAIEAVWSVINTMATMYYCYKHRNKK